MTTFCDDDDQFDAGLVVVAADIFGIGRVEHQKHMLRAGRHAAGGPPRTADRCRSGCSGWRGRRSFVRGVTAARIASTSARSSVSSATTGTRARRLDVDLVDQEAVLGEDRLRRPASDRSAPAGRGSRRSRSSRRCWPGSARAPRRSPRAAWWPSRPDRIPVLSATSRTASIAFGEAPSGFSLDDSLWTLATPAAPRSCPAHRPRCPSRPVSALGCCGLFTGKLSAWNGGQALAKLSR